MAQSVQCIMSQCAAPAQNCQNDPACSPVSGCLKNCGQEYQSGTEDYYECEADCASDLEDNENFQALMNCEGNCNIQAGVMGYDCLKNQCASEWQACQASSSCQANLGCANTCFTYDICLQGCSHTATDPTMISLLNCQISCISSEVANMA